jgi:hypothetical protein
MGVFLSKDQGSVSTIHKTYKNGLHDSLKTVFVYKKMLQKF